MDDDFGDFEGHVAPNSAQAAVEKPAVVASYAVPHIGLPGLKPGSILPNEGATTATLSGPTNVHAAGAVQSLDNDNDDDFGDFEAVSDAEFSAAAVQYAETASYARHPADRSSASGAANMPIFGHSSAPQNSLSVDVGGLAASPRDHEHTVHASATEARAQPALNAAPVAFAETDDADDDVGEFGAADAPSSAATVPLSGHGSTGQHAVASLPPAVPVPHVALDADDVDDDGFGNFDAAPSSSTSASSSSAQVAVSVLVPSSSNSGRLPAGAGAASSSFALPDAVVADDDDDGFGDFAEVDSTHSIAGAPSSKYNAAPSSQSRTQEGSNPATGAWSATPVRTPQLSHTDDIAALDTLAELDEILSTGDIGSAASASAPGGFTGSKLSGALDAGFQAAAAANGVTADARDAGGRLDDDAGTGATAAGASVNDDGGDDAFGDFDEYNPSGSGADVEVGAGTAGGQCTVPTMHPAHGGITSAFAPSSSASSSDATGDWSSSGRGVGAGIAVEPFHAIEIDGGIALETFAPGDDIIEAVAAAASAEAVAAAHSSASSSGNGTDGHVAGVATAAAGALADGDDARHAGLSIRITRNSEHSSGSRESTSRSMPAGHTASAGAAHHSHHLAHQQQVEYQEEQPGYFSSTATSAAARSLEALRGGGGGDSAVAYIQHQREQLGLQHGRTPVNADAARSAAANQFGGIVDDAGDATAAAVIDASPGSQGDEDGDVAVQGDVEEGDDADQQKGYDSSDSEEDRDRYHRQLERQREWAANHGDEWVDPEHNNDAAMEPSGGNRPESATTTDASAGKHGGDDHDGSESEDDAAANDDDDADFGDFEDSAAPMSVSPKPAEARQGAEESMLPAVPTTGVADGGGHRASLEASVGAADDDDDGFGDFDSQPAAAPAANPSTPAQHRRLSTDLVDGLIAAAVASNAAGSSALAANDTTAAGDDGRAHIAGNPSQPFDGDGTNPGDQADDFGDFDAADVAIAAHQQTERASEPQIAAPATAAAADGSAATARRLSAALLDDVIAAAASVPAQQAASSTIEAELDGDDDEDFGNFAETSAHTAPSQAPAPVESSGAAGDGDGLLQTAPLVSALPRPRHESWSDGDDNSSIGAGDLGGVDLDLQVDPESAAAAAAVATSTASLASASGRSSALRFDEASAPPHQPSAPVAPQAVAFHAGSFGADRDDDDEEDDDWGAPAQASADGSAVRSAVSPAPFASSGASSAAAEHSSAGATGCVHVASARDDDDMDFADFDAAPVASAAVPASAAAPPSMIAVGDQQQSYGVSGGAVEFVGASEAHADDDFDFPMSASSATGAVAAAPTILSAQGLPNNSAHELAAATPQSASVASVSLPAVRNTTATLKVTNQVLRDHASAQLASISQRIAAAFARKSGSTAPIDALQASQSAVDLQLQRGEVQVTLKEYEHGGVDGGDDAGPAVPVVTGSSNPSADVDDWGDFDAQPSRASTFGGASSSNDAKKQRLKLQFEAFIAAGLVSGGHGIGNDGGDAVASKIAQEGAAEATAILQQALGFSVVEAQLQHGAKRASSGAFVHPAWLPADAATMKSNVLPRPLPIASNIHSKKHKQAQGSKPLSTASTNVMSGSRKSLKPSSDARLQAPVALPVATSREPVTTASTTAPDVPVGGSSLLAGLQLHVHATAADESDDDANEIVQAGDNGGKNTGAGDKCDFGDFDSMPMTSAPVVSSSNISAAASGTTAPGVRDTVNVTTTVRVTAPSGASATASSSKPAAVAAAAAAAASHAPAARAPADTNSSSSSNVSGSASDSSNQLTEAEVAMIAASLVADFESRLPNLVFILQKQ